jgi:SAM-dependent methyltransferase
MSVRLRVSNSPQVDAYYTPFPIALRICAYASINRPGRIGDLACGDGSLLVAAAQRWPSAHLIANDVSRTALRTTGERCSLAISTSQDILKVASDANSINRVRRLWSVDLILLNPPFSARVKHRHPVAFGVELRAMVSQSAAFLLTAAQLLRPTGELIAVMPSSFLASARDQVARDLLEGMGDVTILEYLPRDAFEGCRAESVVLRLTRRRAATTTLIPDARAPQSEIAISRNIVGIIRGNVKVHETQAGQVGRRRFVHTTDISDGSATPRLLILPAGARYLKGAAVLIPRVGQRALSKISSVSFAYPVALSDCLFALETDSAPNAELLRSDIVSNWHIFEREYVGTGAPHLTATALLRALERLARELPWERAATA